MTLTPTTDADDPGCSLTCHNDSYCVTSGVAADDECTCQDGFLSTDAGCEGRSWSRRHSDVVVVALVDTVSTSTPGLVASTYTPPMRSDKLKRFR